MFIAFPSAMFVDMLSAFFKLNFYENVLPALKEPSGQIRID
jgi:hypothetical protein